MIHIMLLLKQSYVSMYCLFQLFVLVLPVTVYSIATHKLTLNKSHEFDFYMCQSSVYVNNDATLILSTNVTHLIKSSSFCLIDTKYSLTITSSDSSTLATIQCVNGSSSTTQPNGGFAFINLHNLTLQRLLFIDCGAYLAGLNKNILEIINSSSSPVYFTQHHSAVLLFVHIKSVLIDKINIEFYFGFSILMINPVMAFLKNSTVKASKGIEFYNKRNLSIGSGILLLFTDTVRLLTGVTCNVSIWTLLVVHNYDYNDKIKCVNDLHRYEKNIPIINSAGFTILYVQEKFSASVFIFQSNFSNNVGSFSGGMLIFHYNTSLIP